MLTKQNDSHDDNRRKDKRLEHILRKCPDVITPKEVETILRYEHESVRLMIIRGWLQITKAHNAEIVSREWFIYFTCDYAFRIARKSKTHCELLDKYFG